MSEREYLYPVHADYVAAFGVEEGFILGFGRIIISPQTSEKEKTDIKIAYTDTFTISPKNAANLMVALQKGLEEMGYKSDDT